MRIFDTATWQNIRLTKLRVAVLTLGAILVGATLLPAPQAKPALTSQPTASISSSGTYSSLLTVTAADQASADYFAHQAGWRRSGIGLTADYSFNFTPTAKSFSATDSDGRWEGLAVFTGTWPMSWRFQILTPIAAFATSNATEDMYQYVNGRLNGGYHDHHVVPVTYGFHSTVPVNNGGVPYQTRGTFVWKFQTSNASGTATLRTTFDYRITGSTICPHSAQKISTTAVRPNC